MKRSLPCTYLACRYEKTEIFKSQIARKWAVKAVKGVVRPYYEKAPQTLHAASGDLQNMNISEGAFLRLLQ
jgi:hypothetical protein